jgi:hypothetical protein
MAVAAGSGSHKRYQATPEATARILLLIDGFSRDSRGRVRHLEGRTKMAKLDFLLRYPQYLSRALQGANPQVSYTDEELQSPIENRMIRYRYGPWDPSYFAILGSLLGRGLIQADPLKRGFGYRTTERGEKIARLLTDDESYQSLLERVDLIRAHFDWTGNKLKNFVYDTFPEVTNASWTEPLE